MFCLRRLFPPRSTTLPSVPADCGSAPLYETLLSRVITLPVGLLLGFSRRSRIKSWNSQNAMKLYVVWWAAQIRNAGFKGGKSVTELLFFLRESCTFQISVSLVVKLLMLARTCPPEISCVLNWWTVYRTLLWKTWQRKFKDISMAANNLFAASWLTYCEHILILHK